MKRANHIFILTHSYPVFVAAHLYLGTNALIWRALFTVGPLCIFLSLFLLWKNSARRLSISESFNISFLVYNMAIMSVYYILCVYSTAIWVYSNNVHTSILLLLNLIFYLLFYRKLKRCDQ